MTDNAEQHEARLIVVELERLQARVLFFALLERLLIMSGIVVPVTLSVIGYQAWNAGSTAIAPAPLFKAAGLIFTGMIVLAFPVRIMLAIARRAIRKHAQIVSWDDVRVLGIEPGDRLGAFKTEAAPDGKLVARRVNGRWAYISRGIQVVLSIGIALAILWIGWTHLQSGGGNLQILYLGYLAAGYMAIAVILLRMDSTLWWRFDPKSMILEVSRIGLLFGTRTKVLDLSRSQGIELVERGFSHHRLVPEFVMEDGKRVRVPLGSVELDHTGGVTTEEGLLAITRVARFSVMLGFEIDTPEADEATDPE